MDVKEVEIDVYFRASTLKSRMRPGVEFSDHPFDFNGASAGSTSDDAKPENGLVTLIVDLTE